MLKFYIHHVQTIMYTHVEVDESTKKAAINSALAEMAKTLKRRELLAQRGKLPWTGDLNTLRAERNSRDTTLKWVLTPPSGSTF